MTDRGSFLRRLGGIALVTAISATAPAAEERPMAALGAAQVDITPDTPVRMYGYGSRKTESEGVAQRLKASALAIGGDGGEGPAVLLFVESGAVPVRIREEILSRLQTKGSVKPERFVLCNTHIHSGPDLAGMDSFEVGQRERMVRYAGQLTDKLEAVVRMALENRRPGRLDWTSGSVGFAVNRRVLKDGKWSRFGAVPDAPADRALPLLRATDAGGKLMALFVNYACHDTTLRPNFRQIHGDWAGCARECIEADHPGAIVMIALGCGADADPHPHGTVELCQAHGREVAGEVERLLASGPFKPIDPRLIACRKTLEVPYEPLPQAEELKAYAATTFSAERTLKMLESGKPPPPRRYGIAAWTFGDDLAMVFLSNEVVVDYALRLKREFDPGRLWLNAYCDEVSVYIASDRLIGEGGYEANNSLSATVTHGHPERLVPTLETRIVGMVRSMLPATFLAPAPPGP